ncbi:MAG TPA: UDP-N-acetylmuramoyl-tripeptide--D-alanyl-D-alanine ligase [Vicinamibacterales bacterium]|nr:UDP-N-acetylmuramoyl-tripeptide--D-alanyl-D-alanine ligase [Vicinamibacterales bacterium]
MTTDPLSPLTLADVAGCGGGRLSGENRAINGISIDTRQLQPGMLFVALKGEHDDGHDFVGVAQERGASGALVARELPIRLPQIVVRDPLAALTACAHERRRRFSGAVVGVTGSNGKTTTKEMLGAILSVKGPCLVTQGNLNNHIGVPLTLLRLEASHRSAVIEMGANHAGEIAHLASIAEPSVGIVTNAGAAHLEGFGSLEGVARAKGELFVALGRDGTAIVNADDAFAPAWRDMIRGRIFTFGVDQPADFSAHDIEMLVGPGGARQTFDLRCPAGRVRVALAVAGRHNLRNALGAAAAAFAAGAGMDEIREGLERLKGVKGRLDFRPALNGATLIDDSYNANPGSLGAALEVIGHLSGQRWLVLGDMMELGARSDELHREMGESARAAGVDRLFAVGSRARLSAEAFGEGARWFENIDDLIAAAQRDLSADVIILIKGSRANRLERIAAALGPPASTRQEPS